MRCRSLARYMVCNMTENTQLLENSVLERLNAGTTVREFLRAAITLLAEAVAILVTQVFRKDDYAVKYAVEPLLAELLVRLKLVYALGVISRQEYEDAELLMALHEELQQDPGDYRFTDDEIMGPFGELHCVAVFPPSPQIAHAPGDEALAKMQRQRYQQMVRSTMVLSATEYLVRISAKKAFSDRLLLK